MLSLHFCNYLAVRENLVFFFNLLQGASALFNNKQKIWSKATDLDRQVGESVSCYSSVIPIKV